jgi:two-component system, NtrC family, response regulator HydG
MIRILLVEDDVDVRMVMEHVLIAAGYEVDATGTEGNARELLSGRSYDLVIADVRLPDGTGMTVADNAREIGTKALIVTGYASTLSHGAFNSYAILLKPLRPDELLDGVARRLGMA